MSVLLGNGDGTFQSPCRLRDRIFRHSVAVGDFNGDGKARPGRSRMSIADNR